MTIAYDIDEAREANLAEWTTAYMNMLPDSAFLYIAPGGEKDEDGKTKPRTLRYFPYRDSKGDIDLPHLRNAIAQAPKANLPASIIAQVQAKGRKALEGEREDAQEEPADEEKKDDEDDESDEKKPEVSYAAQDEENDHVGCADWSSPIAFAEQGAKWVEIARSGAHFGRASDRQVTLSRDDISSMVRGFATIRRESWFATGAPVGYNHATVMGAVDAESTKAAGRILEVRTETNDSGGLSLFGLIRWTDEARARVRAGEFDGFSIEALPPSEARSKENGKPLGEWALVGGTLTNEPMISGMTPVAAAETRRRRTMDALSILRSTFALTDTATDAEMIAKAQGLIDTAAKVETLTEMLETVKSDRDSLQKDRDELLAWKTQKMLDRACDEGRIFASERDRYARYVAAHGEEEVNNHVFTLNRIKVMGEVGSSSPTSEINPAQGAAAIETQIRASADVLVADGLSDAAAYGRAMIEVLSDPVLRALYESETTTRST